MRVRFSARSDVGMRREVNQDSYGSDQAGRATLLVVCDGMGGHAAGEVASRIGVESIIATFHADASPGESLRNSFISANTSIYEEGRGSMGTTGVAALFLDNLLYIANVGDSRAYLVREGQIRQITRDHSFVSDQIAAGLMTPEEARTSNVRNIITRALGYQTEIEVDIFQLPLAAGDTVLLSSDGMHGLIEDPEIAEVSSMLPPDQAVVRLIDTANARGGHDNITVVIAQVDELDPSLPQAASVSAITDELIDPDAPAKPAKAQAVKPQPVEPTLTRLGLILTGLILLVLIGIGAFLFLSAQGQNAQPTVTPTTVVTVAPTGSAEPQPSRTPRATIAPTASPDSPTVSPARTTRPTTSASPSPAPSPSPEE